MPEPQPVVSLDWDTTPQPSPEDVELVATELWAADETIRPVDSFHDVAKDVLAALASAGRLREPGLLSGLADEMARQDRFHPSGYPATRDGVRLGIAAAQDEWIEARDEWRAERCKCEPQPCGHATWTKTCAELLQLAAVCMRTIRSIDDAKEQP